MQGIILKNINLTGIDIFEQAKKVDEEEKELVEALKEYTKKANVENKNHVIEELWDTFQSRLGLLDKMGIKSEEVQMGYEKHLEKLKSRGYKPRIKQCSKCINSVSSKPYFNGKDTEEYFYCNQFLSKIDLDYANNCKSYEEE